MAASNPRIAIGKRFRMATSGSVQNVQPTELKSDWRV